jgi:hypothetical protein
MEAITWLGRLGWQAGSAGFGVVVLAVFVLLLQFLLRVGINHCHKDRSSGVVE